MLNRSDIIKSMSVRGIDPMNVVLVGGTSMVMKGYIEETRDIDMFVISDTYRVERDDVIDAHYTLPEWLSLNDIDTVIVDGSTYQCQSDESLMRFYRFKNRPKDQIRIKIMESILSNSK